MRILFCNDSFPGRFEALASLVASSAGNDVLFLSSFFRKNFSIPGVSRVQARINRDRRSQDREQVPFFAGWERGYQIGRQTFRTFLHLREAGFVPDIIFASSAYGLGLFLRCAFPESFIVTYLDRYRNISACHEESGDERAALELQAYQAVQSNLCFIFSERQRRLFPSVLQPALRKMPVFVDTDMFSPGDPSMMCSDSNGKYASPEIVSFNMRGMTVQSVRECMIFSEELLARRPQCRVVLCVADSSAKYKWEQAACALPEKLRSRLLVVEFLSLLEYRDFLRSVSVHVCLDTQEPPLHDMLECMSCETLLMTPQSAAVSEFVRHGENALEFPSSGLDARLNAICHVLDNIKNFASTAKKARLTVMERYSQHVVLPLHVAELEKAYSFFRKNEKVSKACTVQ